MTNNRGKIIPIGSALDAIELPSFASMTDEEWAQHDARVAADRARIAEVPDATRRASLLAAGFPKRALVVAATADETKAAICRVRAWLANPDGVLVIAGGKGTGKTVAAAWWATRSRVTPAFARAATFAASSRYDRDDRGALLAAPAAVLDDLGAEYLDAKGSFLVDLDELIDVFYGDCKPLLITTNCTQPLFKTRYGERVTDRIRECGAWFEINSPSMRSDRRAP